MIRLIRFHNRLAEAVAVRRSRLFLGTAVLQDIFAGPVLMSLANSTAKRRAHGHLRCQYTFVNHVGSAAVNPGLALVLQVLLVE
jgi:hypothetical protein